MKLVTCYGSASTRSRVITFFKKSKTFFFVGSVCTNLSKDKRTYPNMGFGLRLLFLQPHDYLEKYFK